MYLKTILQIQRHRQVARVRDIAESLDVSMSSVTAALKSLAAKSLIQHDRYEYVQLTEEGKRRAEDLLSKCEIMGKFFSQCLGVEEGIAKSDACLMEHVVSQETIDRMVQFMEYVDSDLGQRRKILDGFQDFFRRRKSSRKSPAKSGAS
ncbi:metal-dependent transcriptional regulator [bacterium]|nr:metal-dependent transcriptional regulator [bacterium]